MNLYNHKLKNNLTNNHLSKMHLQKQAKEQLNQQPLKSSAQEKIVSTVYVPGKQLINDTIISFAWEKKYFTDFQTLSW